ncbi:MAG TPA: aldo/keto reductase [Vicinamibacterales bacterium]|nr:aldo/keto reductase [Vicinamibacterales bacterium]
MTEPIEREHTRLKLSNGVEMPALGLGVYQIPPEQTAQTVADAIERGYRLIDTAAAYFNERGVGEGIRLSGIAREEVFVQTKLWISDYGYERALRAFDVSLRKLGLDQVDLYLLHWPVPSDFESTVASYEAALKLLAEGRVRAIGVCNFGPKHLEELVARTGVVPSVNQVELHPFFTQKALRQAHARLGIATQAWSPLGGVKRYWTQASREPQDVLAHPVITRLAHKYGKSPAQIVLRWQIEVGHSAIPKSVRAERLAENIGIFDCQLAAEDIGSIEALDTGVRGGPDPDLVDSQRFPLAIEDCGAHGDLAA